jgi:hypothetical protein
MGLFTATLAAFPVNHAPTAAELGTWHDSLDAQSGVWTDWSSSVGWTSGGTAPAIGNGTISAAYIRNGKFVTYAGRIQMGSTTTFGSSNAWSITLPVAALSANYTGSGFCFDASVTANKTPGALIPGLTTCSFSSIGGPVASTVPFTWALNDYLAWFLTYQAA